MAEELQKIGLFIDEIYRLRVQDPQIANETNDLRDECLEYVQKFKEFHNIAQQFQDIMNNYSQMVENEKLKAITIQTQLKSITKQKETEQQIYQSKIQAKTLHLERLKLEYNSLQRIESEQQELINNFLMIE